MSGSIGKGFMDHLRGGLGDKTRNSDVPAKQLRIGEKVEREHTSDPTIAQEIARDHLTEFPTYYTNLKNFEARLKKHAYDHDTLMGSMHEDVENGVERQHSYEYNGQAQRNLDALARGRYLDPSKRKQRRRSEDVEPDTNDPGQPSWDAGTDSNGNASMDEPS